MQYLFESFITKFYQKHKNEHIYEVSPQPPVRWYNVSSDEKSKELLPIMRPDIVLDSEDRKIILDTKFLKKLSKNIMEEKGLVLITYIKCMLI